MQGLLPRLTERGPLPHTHHQPSLQRGLEGNHPKRHLLLPACLAEVDPAYCSQGGIRGGGWPRAPRACRLPGPRSWTIAAPSATLWRGGKASGRSRPRRDPLRSAQGSSEVSPGGYCRGSLALPSQPAWPGPDLGRLCRLGGRGGQPGLASRVWPGGVWEHLLLEVSETGSPPGAEAAA